MSLSIFLGYSWFWPIFSFDILIKYILIKKKSVYELSPLFSILCRIFHDVQLPHTVSLPLPYSRSSLAYLLAFYLPPRFIALLSILFSSLRFTWPIHLSLVFLNLWSSFSAHPLQTSSLVILSCHLTLDMCLTFLRSQLASSPSILPAST